jgi:DNA-binding response OmpR family regulator
MASILVSEADPDVRRLLGILVERLGHDAIVVDPSAEVPPRGDLLILDAASAFALRHLRLVRGFFPRIPVICMGLFESPLDGFEADAVLEKPFTVDALAASIDALLACACV